MSKPTSTDGASKPEKTYFEQQRALLVRDVGASMESVLQNINKLNRSLEGIVAVGGEFSSVEALWSHFENVMAKDGQQPAAPAQQGQRRAGEGAEDEGGEDGEAEASGGG